MVAYQDVAVLASSSDSEERCRAAHYAALCYLQHDGSPEEHAAYYGTLVGFLDDPSVKVRAALAYGLLQSPHAPRPVILALLADSPVIARAVAQYSPALIEADLLPLVADAAPPMLLAIAQRRGLSARLAAALLARNLREVQLTIVRRPEVELAPEVQHRVAEQAGDSPEVRGALLRRRDLPPHTRLMLVQQVTTALRGNRMIKGALHDGRLDRLFRSTEDEAVAIIGERAAAGSDKDYASTLVASERLSTRLLLHALVSGQVLFMADCLAELASTPRQKVITILESGGRPAMAALFASCGIPVAVRGVLVRLIQHARSVDLADDIAARHYVITVTIEELIAEYDADIPTELAEVFAYLNEQNIRLAREAARGVTSALAAGQGVGDVMAEQRMLPAA